ncbi:MAG: hypothetical protein HQL45_09360 [Alphaproteobacteria bacterium]|nr:hypothetical protein [Alphaproteobacteria bacterium]
MPYSFSTYVDNQPLPAGPPLPLCHVTSPAGLVAILTAGKIEAFKDDLAPTNGKSYAFYGRPAYVRERHNGQYSDQTVRHPACILFKTDLLASAADYYPFDTGAFLAGRYDNYLQDAIPPNPQAPTKPKEKKREECLHFLLKNDISTPTKFVPSFYKDNAAYFKAKPSAPLQRQANSLLVEAYFNLINASISTDFDGRARALEVSWNVPLDVNPQTVERIFVSDETTQTAQVRTLLKPFGSNVEYWYAQGGCSERESWAYMSERIRSYMTDRGYLNFPLYHTPQVGMP